MVVICGYGRSEVDGVEVAPFLRGPGVEKVEVLRIDQIAGGARRRCGLAFHGQGSKCRPPRQAALISGAPILRSSDRQRTPLRVVVEVELFGQVHISSYAAVTLV